MKSIYRVIMSAVWAMSFAACAASPITHVNSPTALPPQASVPDAWLDRYPNSPNGYKRMVVALPTRGVEEADLRVELMIGKTLTTDCKSLWFSGALERQEIAGASGAGYYTLTNVAGPMSTLNLCIDDSRRETFAMVWMPFTLLQYQSGTPIVVYVPKDFEVRYRLWKPVDGVYSSVRQ